MFKTNKKLILFVLLITQLCIALQFFLNKSHYEQSATLFFKKCYTDSKKIEKNILQAEIRYIRDHYYFKNNKKIRRVNYNYRKFPYSATIYSVDDSPRDVLSDLRESSMDILSFYESKIIPRYCKNYVKDWQSMYVINGTPKKVDTFSLWQSELIALLVVVVVLV